ncbi:MAG: hypothetical protein AABX89_00640 [Candidatus Thermoplasmatota archaeon]
MDLAERTRDFLADPVPLLADGCAARQNGAAADATTVATLLRGAVVEDLAVKRNVVFLQWRASAAHGAAVVAWDQDGRVTALDIWD